MANATEHPSVMFGTAGRAFHVLENEGVNVIGFLQEIINNPKVRQRLVEIARPVTLFTISDQLVMADIEKFVRSTFGDYRADDSEGQQELRGLCVYYSQPDNLRWLLRTISPRIVSMLVMYYGLDDSASCTLEEVGKHHMLSSEAARRHMMQAQAKMRYDHGLKVEIMKAEAQGRSIVEALGLSERPYMCLRRARIYYLDELLLKTENDLLAITNFGTKSLVEVNTKLAERGLKLKSA